MFWTTVAHAMSPAGGAAPGGDASAFSSIVPIVLMFAVMYFLLFRPQQKRAKEHKAMLGGLKRGDEVITNGGIFGRIMEITDEYAILDMGGGKVKVLRSAIAGLSSSLTKAPDKKGKKDEPKPDVKEEEKKPETRVALGDESKDK